MKFLTRRRTLFRDLIVSLSIITLVSITLLGSALYLVTTVREDARIKVNAHRLTDEINRAVSLPLMNFDRDTVAQIADAYLSSDFVDGIRIQVEGNPFYESIDDSHSGGVMSLNTDVQVNGLKVGKIQVLFSRESIRGKHMVLVWVMVAILACSVLVGIPAMYVLIRHLVGKPLDYLKNGLETIADGQSAEPLVPLPQQDMNDIIQVANQMAEKIRKRTEELRASEARFRDIFENAGHGIFQITPDGGLIRANRSMAAILGFDSQDDLRENFRFIFDQGVIAVQAPPFSEHGPMKVYETQIVRKDKRPIWVRINARLVMGETGDVHCIEGFLDDITDQKHMQEQVLQAKNDLETQVEARTQRLKEKTETMERMNRLFIDRELAMKTLKEENRHLKDRMAQVTGDGV